MAKKYLEKDVVTPNKDAVTTWLSEIDLAKKREKEYRKEGERVLQIYAGKKVKTHPFNILFSNTETLLPAVYSNVPRPVVQRRFKDEDPIGKAGALAATRVLEFLLDTNVDGYETFDDGMKAGVLDSLLPGRGVTGVKYDASLGALGEADPDDDEPAMYKKSELVCLESKPWNRTYFGYARKWSAVPWMAYEMEIDRDEAKRLKLPVDKLKFSVAEYDKADDEHNSDENNRGDKKVACIYQIWDKDGGRKVRYVSPQYKDDYLKVDDDPLELTGFFNCPKPLQFIQKNDTLPVAMYAIYENQAEELNDITRRINLTVKAIKAKAVYDTALGDDIKSLVEAEDNDWVPATNESSMAAEKGFQNAIWFMPIEMLANVLQILVASRDQCKQVIYEITGISDILRGSTVASETATAQKIKSQWGSLRLKRLQKETQRYARDLLRMMLEVAATKFSEETWAKMTGLPFLLEAKFLELQSIQQALKQQAMMLPPPMQGQPPNPITMQLQQVEQQLKTPQWSQVLGMLRDDMQRAYRVDIETNSTVEAEATEDKEQVAEAMAAIGQALNGLTPLVTAGTLPWEAAQAMLLTIVRRFRFGVEVEDLIKSMKPPTPPEDAKKQAEAQQAQMQQQMAQVQQQAQAAQAQATQTVNEMKAKLTQSELEKEVQKREADLELREIKLDYEQKAFKLEKQFADSVINDKVDRERSKLSQEKQVATLQNGKMKTENVVAKKSEETLGKGLQGLEGIVGKMAQMTEQLMQTVTQQAEQNQVQVETLVKAMTAPRKAVRGKDGKIERMEVAA